MLKDKLLNSFKSFLVLFSFFCAGCGYDVISKYERIPSVSYELSWVGNDQHEASSVLVKEFRSQNIEPVFQSNIGQVEKYYIQHESSQINIIFHQSIEMKKLAISIHPSRKSKNFENLQKEIKKERRLSC